ncbi:MAG: SLC13 family permease, partial [Planctomycetota bacterium]
MGKKIYCFLIVCLLFIPSVQVVGAPESPSEESTPVAEKAQGRMVVEDGASDAAVRMEDASELTESAMVTLAVIVFLVVLFAWEPVPLYVTALCIPVFLAILQPWTRLDGAEAISGFSSEATIAIMGMFILSAGVRRTGLIQIMGEKLAEIASSSIRKQVAIISGFAGPTAGFINNTPVVAILIPMVSILARRVKTSPSKLMIPLSFASMMGGT